MNLRRTIAVAALCAATVPLAGTVPAFAKDGEVLRTGSCTGNSDWKVKAAPDDGRFEVEGEVDSNRVGQTWTWKIRHNGTVSAKGTAVTVAPSGSFSVERRMSNLAGVDTFTFRGINPATGEICKGTVKI